MTQKLREQISALADHELPEGEHELLLRRFAVEKSLRLHWERYHLIGEAMRKGLPAVDTRGLTERVMAVITEEPLPAAPPARLMDKLLRGAAGLAIAASVAAVAIVGLKHGGAHPGVTPQEIMPANVAAGETAPLDFSNDASWTQAEQVPVRASLDGALAEQENLNPVGPHGARAKRYANPQDQEDLAKPKAQEHRPPRQY